MFVRKLML